MAKKAQLELDLLDIADGAEFSRRRKKMRKIIRTVESRLSALEKESGGDIGEECQPEADQEGMQQQQQQRKGTAEEEEDEDEDEDDEVSVEKFKDPLANFDHVEDVEIPTLSVEQQQRQGHSGKWMSPRSQMLSFAVAADKVVVDSPLPAGDLSESRVRVPDSTANVLGEMAESAALANEMKEMEIIDQALGEMVTTEVRFYFVSVVCL